jgi:hypothetical protein
VCVGRGQDAWKEMEVLGSVEGKIVVCCFVEVRRAVFFNCGEMWM